MVPMTVMYDSRITKEDNFTLKFNKFDKNEVIMIERFAKENCCNILEKMWRSKYNSYVTYNYEPY